jgi:hypothetical protein
LPSQCRRFSKYLWSIQECLDREASTLANVACGRNLPSQAVIHHPDMANESWYHHQVTLLVSWLLSLSARAPDHIPSCTKGSVPDVCRFSLKDANNGWDFMKRAAVWFMLRSSTGRVGSWAFFGSWKKQ